LKVIRVNFSNRILRRRPRIEQRVLALLRGGEVLEERQGRPDTFRRLRQIAGRKGYVILSASAGYLGDDELTLLGWIAAAQRTTASHLQRADRCLLAALQRCAVVLEEEGLRLRPLTLYKHWLVEG
jgi:hypothetical protein